MRQPITLEKMEATGRQFNVNAMARRIEVDNRIPLRYYYRIAESLLKQANIYREEKNIVDLYIILLRFSGLLSDTIPQHRDYQVSFQREKMWYRKKLYNIIDELESLKPEFHHRLSELNNVNSGAQQDPLGALEQSGFGSVTSSLYSGPCYKNISLNNKQPTTVAPQSWKYIDDHAHSSSFNSMQVGKQFKKLSLSLPPPKDETLSRHSFLGPNGLRGRWVGPKTETKVQYPSYADLTPETSSLNQNGQYGLMAVEDGDSQNNKSAMESVLSLDDGRWLTPADDSCSPLDDEGSKELLQLSSSIRQPSPPPVLAQMKQEFFPISPSKVADPWPGPAKALQHGVANSNSYKNLHIPVKMMDDFLRLAQENTAKNLETCGVLAGSLKNRVFHITTLIVPKQESTSDSCQTLNEEEIFEIQDKCSLFSLGWIHTHPSQTCFMSSVDLHTHYSYQIMLPEAIAIVMAPTDISSPQGIFNLSDPGGVSVIRNCQQRGFHPHEEPSDGSPIYEHCSHVYMNPNLKFDVVDLR